MCTLPSQTPRAFQRVLRQGRWPLVRCFSGAAQAADASEQITQRLDYKGVVLDGRPVYLDNQATTPLDPRVLDYMMFLQTEKYGNPHSSTHFYGWETDHIVETARAEVADLINADPKEIVFTSGATESNNLAIKGCAAFYNGKKNHIITVQTEHKCVLESCRQMELQGWDVTYLPVGTDGLVDLDAVRAAIRPDTAVLSCMYVNNEIGVVQPIADIGKICREHKVFFHTDAAQGLGKLPIDVNAMNIDMMSMSGHKIYGPKGVGAMYVRRKPRVRLLPIISGGGQERNLRSGTLPAPLVAGFGRACSIAKDCMEDDHAHVVRLSNRLYNSLTDEATGLAEVILNGDHEGRYPGNLNLSFAFVEGESLLMGLKNVAVSSGSACTSASLEPSYVLRAIGVGDDLAHTSIRYGIGRFTSESEVDYVAAETIRHVKRLRELSPLWEMHTEGVDVGAIQWT